MKRPTYQQKQQAVQSRSARATARPTVNSERETTPDLPFVRPQPSADESNLRSRIQKFAFTPRFSQEFERAMGLFWGTKVVRRKVLTEEQEGELPEFQEWYFFDFVTSKGKRIIDLFAQEEGPDLTARQQTMLADWRRTNRARLVEVQEITPGEGEVVLDLLSGEVLHCNDISFSHTGRRWLVLVVRPLYTEGHWHFTGRGQLLTPMHKEEILAAARNLWADYHRQYPAATYDDFYRDRSLELRKAATKVLDTPLYTHYLTAEGHTVINATAEYRIRGLYAVKRLLDEAAEFQYVGTAEGKPQDHRYCWLLRGRSHVPATDERPDKALELRTEWSLGPGEPHYLNLGDITLNTARLELECLSRERLAVGKALIEELLGDLIIHRRDHFAEFKAPAPKRASAARSKPASAIPEEIDHAMQKEMLAEQRDKILTQPIPKLGGQTAREAAQTAEGRAHLEEWLKPLEYMAEEKRLEGKPYIDVQDLRRELGLA